MAPSKFSRVALSLLWTMPLLWFLPACAALDKAVAPLLHPDNEYRRDNPRDDDNPELNWEALAIDIGVPALLALIGGPAVYAGVVRPRRIARENGSKPNGNLS